jgi:hypothetical protein
MAERTRDYLRAIATLDRATTRCDGLIADVAHHYEALRQWQECAASSSAGERLDEVLANLLLADPPSWTTVRTGVGEWVDAARRAAELWDQLSTDDRVNLEPPTIRFASETADA